MKTAAVYCRVSTDTQELEGTSLQTQMDACLEYCRDRGYEVAYRFSEAYSGLSLARPELDRIRELVRSEQINVLIVYSLDRLSRDPTHGVILTQELEKHHVTLEAVTETVDSSELGKLISYIRGFASKVEAEKIKERTVRGRLARAKEGRVSGGFHTTYGYDYLPVSQKGGGHRVINETEARWVRQIFQWLVSDGLASGTIRDRLTALGAPTKEGKAWRRSTIIAIVKNPSYAGKTYAFTSVEGRVRHKPQEEWIELPGVTPAIISQEVFEAAQKQLQVNRNRASRNNTRQQYLLRGHIRCRRCGHAYIGGTRGNRRKDGNYQRVYLCGGRSRDNGPLHRCLNKVWSADKLEAIIWAKLEEYLSKPDLIISEIEKQRRDADQLGVFESQLQDTERQLKAVDREQSQLLQWALKGFPESQVEAENRRLNKSRDTLTAQMTELEAQIKASRDAVISIPKLEAFIRRIQNRMVVLDFEGKRQVLEGLDITVWLDGEGVEITGFIPAEEGVFVTTPSYKKEIPPLRSRRGGQGVRLSPGDTSPF